MNGDLDKLIQFIAKHFRFEEGKYPELKGADETQHRLFAVQHVAIHFAKTAGKIVAISEEADHAKEIDMSELKRNVPKSLINTLRLAELVGMTEADIIKAIEEQYGESLK